MPTYYIGSMPCSGDHLSHHGILGQRWGVRNGPPYPLGGPAHSASERKAGWRKSLSGGHKSVSSNTRKTTASGEKNRLSKSDDKKKKKSEDVLDAMSRTSKAQEEKIRNQWKDETAQKVSDFIHSDGFKKGMKIAITVAAIYAASKIGKHFLQKYATNIMRQEYESLPKVYKSLANVPKALSNYHDDYFSSTDKNAWRSLTHGINHGVNETNFMSTCINDPGRTMNCTFCSASIIMKLKGFETTASKLSTGLPSGVVKDFFNGAKFKKPKAQSAKALYKYLLKQGDGSYGTLHVFFKNGGGHSIVYTVKNGAVQIIDGQIDASYGDNLADLSKNLFSKIFVNATEVCDLTNCDPTEYILRALM